MSTQILAPGAINLSLIPQGWGLVACGKRKQPYQKQWQNSPLTTAQIQPEINAHRCHAVGVLCGVPSGGLLFLDHDGPSCTQLVEQLSGVSIADALPTTLTISSGRPGRAQYVYRVPQLYWDSIKTHKVATGAIGDDGKPEQLEFRWNGCQSVVMGHHPTTPGYKWLYDAESIAEAPQWMMAQMLETAATAQQNTPNLSNAKSSKSSVNKSTGLGALKTDADWALSYLASIPSTEDYDTWLHVGMALHSVSPDLLQKWEQWSSAAGNYDPEACTEKWRSFKKSGTGIATLGWMAKRHGWTSDNKTTSTATRRQNSGNTTKPSDSNGLGHSVNASTDFEGGPSESLITDKEWERFSQAMRSPGSFDPFQWLPERLSTIARSDAARNCIDPMAIWAYLLPATLSMMGNNTWLDMSGWKVPNIIWSLLIGESGTGKSRAKNLVIGPIEKWNIQEFDNWKARVEDWVAQDKARQKDKSDDGPAPEKPRCRRWLVSQSTPEGIVRRLADQENNGVLGYRDEFAGFIKGLTQYTAGKGDGMEMMLETWDGGSILVDRADEDKSFSVESSRLSLAGGIQPRVFERTFETGEDSQGILARFLCVVPAELPYKRYKGASVLPSELAKVYKFIDSTDWGTIIPSSEADDLFTEIAEDFNNQTAPSANAQPWIRKLAGQTLRLAMAIHALECYYTPEKATGTLTADTLGRAWHMAKHYQTHFYHLMGATATEGLEGILAKIQDAACCSGDGISARDIVRGAGSRYVQAQARLEQMKPGDFCAKLFDELATAGYGEIVEHTAANGRTVIKYKAFSEKCAKSVDALTPLAEPPTEQGFEAVNNSATASDNTVDVDAVSAENQGFEVDRVTVTTVDAGVDSTPVQPRERVDLPLVDVGDISPEDLEALGFEDF